MYILGISAFYHDSAAALIKNGEIIAAAEEERFTRIKHDKSFPKNAVEFCLQFAEIELKQISYIIFYDKPFLKFERILETYLLTAPWGSRSFSTAMTEWLSEGKLILSYTLKKEFLKFSGVGANELPKLLFSEHHQSHAASAFFPSPFFEAAVLCIDGVGEWATTSCWLGKDNGLTRLWQIEFPHSLGLLYSAFTHYLGFRVNDGEYKLMGLAADGTPRYISQIKKYLVAINDDGSFSLNLNYFNYTTDSKMTNARFHDLFGSPPRRVDEKITQNHMDIASSIQNIIEEILLKLAVTIKKETGQKNLCLAGVVAFNCMANTKIIDSGLFENVWIQPAAGDSGGALGAALLVWNQYLNKKRIICENDPMKGALLGPAFTRDKILFTLAQHNCVFTELSDEQLFCEVSSALERGLVVGWFQGRMEFGPRALGSRSILARTDVSDKISMATQVGNSACMQTVSKFSNEKFYALFRYFEHQTDASPLISTSFNIREEPIVCSPEDALCCFMSTDIDYLAIGEFLLKKTEQPQNLNIIRKNKSSPLTRKLLHEDLAELKKFGLKTGLFVVVLFYFSLPSLFHYKAGFWPLVAGAMFVAIAFLKPQKLMLANEFSKIFWTKFLKTQGFVFWNLIYYLVFTPYALLARPWLKGFKTSAERKHNSVANQELLKNLHRQF